MKKILIAFAALWLTACSQIKTEDKKMNKTIQETIMEVYRESRKVSQTHAFMFAIGELVGAVPDLNGNTHTKLQEEVKRLTEESQQLKQMIDSSRRELQEILQDKSIKFDADFSERSLSNVQLVKSLNQAIELIQSLDWE